MKLFLFVSYLYIFKLLSTYSVPQGYEAVTHPSSCGAFTANVWEHPLVTRVRSAEWHFFNRLINNKRLQIKENIGFIMYTLIRWKDLLHKVIPYEDTVMSDSNFYLDL